jgi:aminoglycoside phosphotransferase (APT) family kinase protein
VGATADTRALPEDPGIPALAAMREQGVGSVLRAAGVGFDGGTIELAQHHPGLRCTLIAGTGEGRLVVKAYPNRTQAAAVAELLQGLRAAGLASGVAPTAPPLVAFDAPLSLLVTRWIEGPSARELVVRGEGSRAGQLAAEWLQAVSKLELDAGRLFGPERAVKDAGKSAAAIADADAALGRQAAAVVAAMEEQSPSGDRVAVSNGSFRPKHVLDLADGPGVIDWDGFRRGQPELDGGMFLAGLAQLVEARPEAAAAADAAARAFRRRLGGLVQERALAWYEAGALLRLARYDSDPASPRWRAGATALVGRARALLDGT